MQKQNIKSSDNTGLNKFAFTLVELIVVITILAILGTIAFFSLQGYSTEARDSTRISDLGSMKTTLELFNIESGKYPLPTNGINVTYSGATVWKQGTFGESVSINIDKLDKIPKDTLTDKEYTYSVTNVQNEYELAGLLEGDAYVINNQIIGKSNAATVEAIAYTTGNYNGTMAKSLSGTTCDMIGVPTIIANDVETTTDLAQIVLNKGLVYNGFKNLPSSFKTTKFKYDGGFDFTTSSLIAYSDTGSCDELKSTSSYTARVKLLKGLQNTYSGTLVENIGEISKIISLEINTSSPSNEVIIYAGNFVNNTIGGKLNPEALISSVGGLISQSDCTSAGWIWVDGLTDVNIGSTKGKGFCISPLYGAQAGWPNGSSWNGWGNSASIYYNGWDATSIDDTGNPGVSPQYGQTKRLDSEVSYNCKGLGTASSDFDTSDTIVGRMKWLVTSGNTYPESRGIDWITGLVPHTVGVNPQPIPVLYIADCIDGVKDLGTTLTYKHINDSTENITYAQYNTDVSSNTDNASLADTVYLNRQKYLTAWTQKSGSHLPSAMSYITSGFASASDADGNFLTGVDRGEYQVACDASLFPVPGEFESVYTAAIGSTSGSAWGNSARVIGETDCGYQFVAQTGIVWINSARFIVRP